MPARPLSEITMAACLFFIFLAPLAAAGLALMNAGLGRSHSATHVMMASLLSFSIAGIVFFFCGFSFAGYVGGPAYSLAIGGHTWNWLGAQPFFFRGINFF